MGCEACRTTAATCYWYEHMLLPLLGDTEPGDTIPVIDSWVTFKVGRGLTRRPMSMQALWNLRSLDLSTVAPVLTISVLPKAAAMTHPFGGSRGSSSMPLPPLATCSHSSRYTADDPLISGFHDSPSLSLRHHSWQYTGRLLVPQSHPRLHLKQAESCIFSRSAQTR